MELVPVEELEEEVGRADEYAEKIHQILGQIRKVITLNPLATTPRDASPPSTQNPDHSPSLRIQSWEKQAAATVR